MIYYVSANFISFRFVFVSRISSTLFDFVSFFSLHFDSLHLFRFVSIGFVSFRSVSFRFVWFRFVSFGFASFRSVSFRFYFVLYFTDTQTFPIKHCQMIALGGLQTTVSSFLLSLKFRRSLSWAISNQKLDKNMIKSQKSHLMNVWNNLLGIPIKKLIMYVSELLKLKYITSI